MAFQTGTQVRPELGRADVSGFARGGAAIGAGILQGIQNYQQQKQITASALSDLEGRMAADPSMLQAMQQAGENNPKLAKSLKNLAEGNFNQADVLSLDGFASAFEKQKIASQQSQLRAAQLSALEAKGQPVSPFEPSTREIGGVTYVETQKGKFQPLEQPSARGGVDSAPVGRTVTMEQLQELQGKGFKPTVEFGVEGEMVLTSMGTFAPKQEGPIPQTVGQEKMLEETAKSLAPWGTGGKQQAEANLETYDNLIAGLASGEITTRGFADLTPQALGIDDTIRQIFNPTGQNAVDNVRRVIFQGLKDTLGAQFTQREAERLVAASYNPALSEEMNIQRLQDARNVLSNIIQAKNDLYEHIATGGNMGNYKGVLPTDVLSSGIKDAEEKYDADLEKEGFQAPSGINIRLKSKRPSN